MNTAGLKQHSAFNKDGYHYNAEVIPGGLTAAASLLNLELSAA